MTNTEVKITGSNDIACHDLMAHKTHTAPELLYQLVRGCWAVKVGKSLRPATFILTLPTFLLEDRHALTPIEWEILVARQLNLYYRPVQSWSAERPMALAAGADPAEFLPLYPPAAAPDPGTAFPRRQQLPRTPKYRFFLQHRFN